MIPIDVAHRLAALMPAAHVAAVDAASGFAIWRDEYAVERLVAFLSQDWSGVPTNPPRTKPGTAGTPTIGRAVLTKRELDVLRLVALGRMNAHIRDELFISPNTVSQHLRAIFAKTGSTNRTEAAASAHRHGLIR